MDLRAGNESVYATYQHFRVDPPADYYRLHLGSYSGTAGEWNRETELTGRAPALHVEGFNPCHLQDWKKSKLSRDVSLLCLVL